MKISIIGGGNMGQAFARGLSGRDFALTVSDPNLDKIKYLEDLGIITTDHNNEAADDAAIVIIAVKPGMVQEVLTGLNFKEGVLLVSVAAGITIKQIEAWSGINKVVRVMPNTPALIQQSMSGWCTSKSVTDEERLAIQELLAAVGNEIEVEDEELIDVVTAISGSGPAYVFYFLEAMVEEAEDLGLDKQIASELAVKTFIGAASLAEAAKEDFDVLRDRVTSKGGTTEAALNVMEEGKMKDLFKKAINKAVYRSRELRD